MWSAVIGGAIFAVARRSGRLRPAWSILIAYLGMALLHAAFDTIGGVLGYIVISAIGIVPLVWLWRRSDGRATQAVAA